MHPVVIWATYPYVDDKEWISDGEDGDFWVEEDGQLPYPVGDFPLVTMLDWALSGDEGIKDLTEDTPRKGKGSRELLNLECFIIHDVKGSSSRHEKSKAYAIQCLRVVGSIVWWV